MFFGYPATVSGGYGFAAPAYGKAVAPAGFYGKPYGKVYGKPYGKVYPGFPGTFGGGYGSVIPATTVATGPSVI